MAPDPTPTALVCSVALEAEPLLARLDRAEELRIGGKPAVSGTLGGVSVVVLVAGMGKTNAAHALTALLEGRGAGAVIGFGVGGAYPGSGLGVGGLALATREVYGDEGVATPTGWISTEGIGIPLVEQGGTCLHNDFPLDPARVARARELLETAGLETTGGPFVTVSCCSGTAARGAELAERFGAICETMEGAAYAHVCALYDTPFLELRGISNAVEDRDLSRWRLHEAAARAAHGAERLLQL